MWGAAQERTCRIKLAHTGGQVRDFKTAVSLKMTRSIKQIYLEASQFLITGGNEADSIKDQSFNKLKEFGVFLPRGKREENTCWTLVMHVDALCHVL